MKLNILCATSGVGNAGIESSEIWAVYRVDSPPSITYYVSQERGRAGRRDDETRDTRHQTITFIKCLNRLEAQSRDVSHRNYQNKEGGERRKRKGLLCDPFVSLFMLLVCVFLNFDYLG